MTQRYSVNYEDLGAVAQDVLNRVNAELHNLDTLNIIVCGKTGVGKSTLINSLFRENLAEVGFGREVTQEMRRYKKPGFPLAIYDTRGFELGPEVQENIKQGILNEVRRGNLSEDLSEHIHCIWYCVSTPANRFETTESQWLKELSWMPEMANIPIIVILTQSDKRGQARKLRDYVISQNPEIPYVIPVLAQDVEDEDDDGNPIVKKAYGLEDLIEVMADLLPEPLKKALANVLDGKIKAALELKIAQAHKIVLANVGIAVTDCVAPIPLADALLLIPTQFTMIAQITSVFGIKLEKATVVSIVSGTLGSGGATLLGKTIVSNFFKLFPGVGTTAGIAVGGVTAGALTLALGETFIVIMSMIYKGELKAEYLGSKEGRKLVSFIFNEQAREARENIKNVITSLPSIGSKS